MRSSLRAIVLLTLVVAAAQVPAGSPATPVQQPPGTATAAAKPETTSLLGVPLYPVQLAPEARAAAEASLQKAREELAKAPRDADAILWLGRRQAVAGHVRDAIDIFTARHRDVPVGRQVLPASWPPLRDPA